MVKYYKIEESYLLDLLKADVEKNKDIWETEDPKEALKQLIESNTIEEIND